MLFGNTLERADYFYKLKNYSRALKLYLKLVDQDNAEIYFKIGNCYRYLDQIDKAEEFWLKAAEQGSSSAAQNLGNHYFKHNQIAKAKTYFEKGAASGRPDSMYQLAQIAAKFGTEEQKNKWLAKAAEKNHGKSLYEIASYLYSKNDLHRALELAIRAKALKVEGSYILVNRIQLAINSNSTNQSKTNPTSDIRENIYGFKQGSDFQRSSQSTYRQPKPKPCPKFTVMSEAEEAAAVWMRYLGFNAKVGGSTTAADKGIDVWSNDAVAQVKMHGKPVGSQMLHTFDSQANLHARNRKKLFFSWNGYNSGAIDVADQLGIYLFHIYSHGELKPINHLAKNLWTQAG